MNTIFITLLFCAEMTSYIHCYYNHNTNKQTAGYNYSKPQVVCSAWLFWWQDSNFFLQLHFLLPFRVCRVQALFSMKACHLPLESVAALQHLARLKESLQSIKLINLRRDVKMTNVAFLSLCWYGWYKFDWWNKRAILIHLYLPLHLSTLKAYKNTPELS